MIEDNVARGDRTRRRLSRRRILGIWENAQAHTSDITVAGNEFTNLTTGGSPATNSSERSASPATRA